MTVVRALADQAHAFAKGAPETILDQCSHILTERGVVPMSDGDRARMLQASAVLATDALRVLAFAERSARRPGNFNSKPIGADEIESGMTFLGLIGIHDPPRAAARDAVAQCRRAGIRIVMITGDHPELPGRSPANSASWIGVTKLSTAPSWPASTTRI